MTHPRSLEKRVLLTRGEVSDFRSLLHDMDDALYCAVLFSSLMRALMRLAVERGDDIVAAAEKRRGDLKVAKHGDEEALVRFEEQLSEIVAEALKCEWVEE